MAQEFLLYGNWSKNIGLSLLATGVEESKVFDHTLLYFVVDGAWKLDRLFEWSSSGLNYNDNNEVVVLGQDGEFAVGANNSYEEGVIENIPTTTGLFNINNSLYVTAMSSQIFKSENGVGWKSYIKGVSSDNDHFTCMDGNSEIMYVAGWNGVCYMNSTNVWSEVTLPTNEKLTSISVSQKGLTVITGFQGTLLVGAKEEWEVIEHNYMLDDFWKVIISPDGQFYIAGNQAIYELIFNDGEWSFFPIFGWLIEENGIFSDMFFEGKDIFRVLSEKGLFKRVKNEWISL